MINCHSEQKAALRNILLDISLMKYRSRAEVLERGEREAELSDEYSTLPMQTILPLSHQPLVPDCESLLESSAFGFDESRETARALHVILCRLCCTMGKAKATFCRLLGGEDGLQIPQLYMIPLFHCKLTVYLLFKLIIIATGIFRGLWGLVCT